MTAPKKRGQAATVKSVPETHLSDMEIRVALAFRGMNPTLKLVCMETMENVARNYAREVADARPALSLRLVVGGSQ